MAAAGTAKNVQPFQTALLQELQPHLREHGRSNTNCSHRLKSSSKPLGLTCSNTLPSLPLRKSSRHDPTFLAGSLILPAGHSRKHRFLLQSKPGGKTAYAETRDKGGASVSSADSELDRLESAAEKEVENGMDARASSGNGVAKGEEEEAGGGALASGGALAGVLLVATLATMAGLGYMYKDQINTALIQFQGVLESRSLSSLEEIYLI
jgi:hypothetical protein